MDNDIDNEMEDFEEEIADGIEYDFEEEDIPSRRSFLDFISQRKPLILGGIGVLLLIVLIALFFGGGDTLSEKDLTSFEARLDSLEERLTRFEWVEVKVTSLEKRQEELEQYMAEADISKRHLTQQFNKLSKRVGRLQKGKAPVSVKAQGPTAIKRKPLSLGKKRFHEVRSGETLYRIARQYGISVDKLCRLNNITQRQAIQPGQKLVVSP